MKILINLFIIHFLSSTIINKVIKKLIAKIHFYENKNTICLAYTYTKKKKNHKNYNNHNSNNR